MRSLSLGLVAVGVLSIGPGVIGAQAPAPAQSQARQISVTWTQAPIRDVLQAFAAFSGRSIVAGSNVTGFVTADINDEPWDVSLRTILESQGLVGIEDEYGIIRVDDILTLNDRESVEPVITRSYRISYSRASEIQQAIQALLSGRGSVSTVESNNTLVVSDIARVQLAIEALLR